VTQVTFRRRAGFQDLVLLFLLAMAAALLPAVPVHAAEKHAGRPLTGRWNIAFQMPQGNYETPVEFTVGHNGEVKAALLGPLGTFRITDTKGTLKGSDLTLGAKTSFGDLRLKAVLEGDRLRGKWFPAGFVARLFFKGELRGLRDRAYVPKPRLAAFDAAFALLERDFYAPDYNGVDLQALRQRYRSRVEAASSDGEFVTLMRAMLAEFRTSHLDFFATPSMTPELHPTTATATATATAVKATEGITWRQLSPAVGYLRIESFEDGPQVVARVDRAFAELDRYPSLVVDLRGNGGGTLSAAMRIGDHVLPTMQPVGYFASRHGLIRRGLRSIDQLEPASLPGFSGYDGGDFTGEMIKGGALMLATGGRAPQRYRGRIVVLIDEYCFSATEALVGIVKETRAATLIGRRTAGAMLAAIPFPVEGGWTLLLPVFDFRTPQGSRVEGRGIEPDILVKASQRKDADLAAALKFLNRPSAAPSASR
jgi:pimeloyl-ACP methyl ester carboxylesterase